MRNPTTGGDANIIALSWRQLAGDEIRPPSRGHHHEAMFPWRDRIGDLLVRGQYPDELRRRVRGFEQADGLALVHLGRPQEYDHRFRRLRRGLHLGVGDILHTVTRITPDQEHETDAQNDGGPNSFEVPIHHRPIFRLICQACWAPGSGDPDWFLTDTDKRDTFGLHFPRPVREWLRTDRRATGSRLATTVARSAIRSGRVRGRARR